MMARLRLPVASGSGFPTTQAAFAASGTLAVNTEATGDATTAPITLTLPTPGKAGDVIYVEKIDASTNAVTVSGTLRGSAGTIPLALRFESVLLVAESASSWRPYAGHKTLSSLDSRYPQKSTSSSDQGKALDAYTGLPVAGVTPTATKTAAYTAAANDLVPVDASTSSRQVYDAVTTSSSATVTSATGAFTNADVGKSLSVLGFNPGVTVLSVQSTTSLTASANATASGSAQTLTIGGPGTVTVTLPASALAGTVVAVKKTDSTAKQVLVAPNGADTIDGLTALAVIGRRYATRRFRKTSGTDWLIEDAYNPYPLTPSTGNIVDWVGDSIAPQSSNLGTGALTSMNGSGKFDDYLWWAHLLSNARLQFGRPGGIGSTRADQMLARLNDHVLREPGHFCGIQTGTNDASLGTTAVNYATYIRAMCSIIVNSGRVPILCTNPPIPTTSSRVLDDAYRRFLIAYARDNGWPLVDFYALLIDSSTGTYLSAYDSGDQIHPNTAGKKAMGQLLSDTLTSWLPPWRPTLEQVNSTAAQIASGTTGPSATLLPNGLFLSDAAASTTVTGWTKTGSQTYTVVANETGIKGQSLRIQDSASSGFSQISSGVLAGTTTGRGGHRIGFGGLVKVNGTGTVGPNLQCNLVSAAGGANTVLLRALTTFAGVATPGWQQFYCEGWAPSDCNAISVTLTSNGGTNVDAQAAQLGVYDLTNAGL